MRFLGMHPVAGVLAMLLTVMAQQAPPLSNGCYLTTTVITFDAGFQSFASMTRPTNPSESPIRSTALRSETSITSTGGAIDSEPTIESTLVNTVFGTMSSMSLVPQSTFIVSSSELTRSQESFTRPQTLSGSSISPLAASVTTSGVNTATASDMPVPTLEPGDAVYLSVNVQTAKAKRATFYIAFDSKGFSILADSKAFAAIFIIDSEGRLLNEGKYIGTSTTSGTVALQQFDEPPLNPLRIQEAGGLVIGAATFCSTSSEAFYVVFNEDPPDECSEVVVAAETASVISSSASMTFAPASGSSTQSLVQSSTSNAQTATAGKPADSSSSNAAGSFASTTNPPSNLTPSSNSVREPATSLSSRPTPSSSPVRDYPSSFTRVISSSSETTQTSSRIVTFSSAGGVSTPSTILFVPTSSASTPTSILSQLSQSLSSMSSSSTTTFSSVIRSASSTVISGPSTFSSGPASTLGPVTTTSSQTSLVSSGSMSRLSSSTGTSTASISSASTANAISTTTSAVTVRTTSTASSSSTVSSATTTPRPTSCVIGNRTLRIPPPRANRLPGKRGLAYSQVSTLRFYKPPTQVSWAYNYAGRPNNTNNVGPFPPSADLPLDFYPLLFNDKISLETWFNNASDSIETYGSDVLFSFNEPDFCIEGSSCMTVQQAVTAYEKYMQPFAACGVRLAAPSVTNAGQGFPWLQQFMGNATARNLTVDIINLHWYACAYCQSYFEEYFTNASRLFPSKPIWITEYGIGGKELQEYYSESDTNQFIKNSTWWAEKQPWIEKIAWFGNYPGKARLLKDDSSGLNILGETWSTYVGTGYVGYSQPRLAAQRAERWNQTVQEEGAAAYMPGNLNEADLRVPAGEDI